MWRLVLLLSAGFQASAYQKIQIDGAGTLVSAESKELRRFPQILHIGTNVKKAQEESSYFFERNFRSQMWQKRNPGWKVDVLDDGRIMELAKKRFPQATAFLQSGVKFGAEKSDIGRLLALEADGGVYVDSDVDGVVPIDNWSDHFHYQKHGIDLILGVQTPERIGANPLQISNWAMASMPGNPIIKLAIEKIIKNAPSIKDTENNIGRRTGPAAMTTAILEALDDYGMALPDMGEFKEGNGHLFNLQEKDGNKTKVLVLPYRAFGFHPGNGVKFGQNHLDNLVEKQPHSEPGTIWRKVEDGNWEKLVGDKWKSWKDI